MPRPRSERLSAPRVLGHVVVMLAVAAVMGLVAAGLAIPFAGVLGIGTKQVASGMTKLPAELKTEPLAQRTVMVDAAGNVIATLFDENRINVPLSQISRKMVKSIVAIEDYRYYQHGALDLKGTLRALITNQANNGVVQGGSSITQQMVKMTLLAQAKGNKKKQAEATDDTYARKVRELRYAIAFEQHYSKDWILERYLNLAYFGDGAYGIQSAAKHYFNKNAKDLNWGESAVLAGLVKNPTGFDPTNYPDRALERRDIVLDRMAQLSVIQDSKAEQLKKKGLGLDPVNTNNGCVFSRAPFFCDYVLNRLYHDKSLGDTVSERKELLKSGGLTIHTTIDLRMQDAADASVADHVYADRHGHRRPGHGRAAHRRREGPRPVPPDGPRPQEGRDLPQLHRPQAVRRLRRLPGRVDVQGVRARGGDPEGHPARHQDLGAVRRSRSRCRSTRPAVATTSSAPTSGSPRTPPTAAPSTSTPARSTRSTRSSRSWRSRPACASPTDWPARWAST